MIKWIAGVLAGALLSLASILPASAQDTLAKIKKKGVIVVGVKNDYKPWGFLDPSGKIVGLEIDLAQEIAEKLGVKLEMLPVTAANRMEFLQQGRIDLVIATMGDTEDRRRSSAWSSRTTMPAPPTCWRRNPRPQELGRSQGPQGLRRSRRLLQSPRQPDL